MFKSDVCSLTGERNYYFGLQVEEVRELNDWIVVVRLLDGEGNPLSLEGFKSHLLNQFPEESDWEEREVSDMFQNGMVESLKEELTTANIRGHNGKSH